MTELYPPIEPYDQGMLDVGEGNLVYWEVCGRSTTRRSEIDWLYRGVARFFPEEWEQFRAGVPEADRDGDLVSAYACLMEHPDPDVRATAAKSWCAWELARAWPDAELTVIADSGHTGSDTMRAHIRTTLDKFARPMS